MCSVSAKDILQSTIKGGNHEEKIPRVLKHNHVYFIFLNKEL